MQTSNSIYGSGLHPLAAPAAAPTDTPTIVPHFTQTAYPYKPRAKAQLFNSAILPSGQRIVFEKPVAGGPAASTTTSGMSGTLGSTGKSYAGVLPRSRLDASVLTTSTSRTMASSLRPESKEKDSEALPDEVLRFYAYWHEGVPESSEESERFRLVLLIYYLIDGSLQVSEPRQDNSGLIQGPVLHRHRVPKYPEGVPGMRKSGAEGDGDDVYDWTDLLVGDEVNLYGRVYHIYDADGFTRSWYAARGVALADAEEVPTDAVGKKLAKAKVSGGKSDKGHNRVMFPAKLYAEARLGKFIRDPEARRKFQAHDGKVLKFDCLWDDTKSESGDAHHLVMQYFLADDQAEIRFVHANNDGYPSTVSLLRKGPMPKDWIAARDATASEKPDVYFKPSDLMVGNTIDVYGRKVFIRAVDPWTREWYSSEEAKTEYGCAPQPDNIAHDVELPKKPVFAIPPHNGIGSEEDSLQSCFTFNVKPLKSDYNKWALNDGVVFRFHARIETANLMDKRRRFTIACYPSDDSISIYEPPVKNSGFKGGVFLKRSKYRKADGKPYLPSDFRVGTTVAVFSHRFTIMDADKFTRENLPHLLGGVEPARVPPSNPAYNPDVDNKEIIYDIESPAASPEASPARTTAMKQSVRFEM